MCMYDLPMCPCAWVTYRACTHVAPQQPGQENFPNRGTCRTAMGADMHSEGIQAAVLLVPVPTEKH